jgi:rod shape-determining protein MreC
MRTLLQFIIRNHFFFLFLLMEIFSFTLIFRYNNYQRAGILNFASAVQGFTYSRINSFKDYLNLYKINQDLVNQNTQLQNQLDHYQQVLRNTPDAGETNLPGRKYTYTPARVISNSVNRQYNFLTLDRGRNHGIEPEMAVISPLGVVGVVYSVSANYSTVISLLNRDFMLSVKIKRNNYFGPMTWEGINPGIASLSEIPYHVNVQKGDTIVTSGYSTIFPEGLLVGTISDFKVEGSNFFRINVELSENFRQLTHVYIINNLLSDEQVNLEEKLSDD